jgi:hypothetical protein
MNALPFRRTTSLSPDPHEPGLLIAIGGAEDKTPPVGSSRMLKVQQRKFQINVEKPVRTEPDTGVAGDTPSDRVHFGCEIEAVRRS